MTAVTQAAIGVFATHTGLANPGPVATALWTDAELEAGVTLDGIVTVADARHLPRQLAAAPAGGEEGSGGGGTAVNEAQQQIAYSDVVLLNKVSRPAGLSCLRGRRGRAGALCSDRSLQRVAAGAKCSGALDAQRLPIFSDAGVHSGLSKLMPADQRVFQV